MKRKTNLILFGTVFAVIGTVYAFSGYSSVHSCNNLLSLGTSCNTCELNNSGVNFSTASFFNSNNISYDLSLKTTGIINTLEDKEISFFNVPLVCNAAPSIGCGSRAKPVLTSFEKSPNVKEAWLNREGTIIAVVWKDGIDVSTKTETVNTVFTEHNLNANEVSSEEYSANYNSFKSHEGWLKGSEVDKLSQEEASIFAKRITNTIKENTNLSITHLRKIEQKVNEGFYDFFLNYKSINDLGNPDSYKAVLKDVIDYGNELVGKDVMPSIDTLWDSCSNISNTSESCCNTGESCSSTIKAID